MRILRVFLLVLVTLLLVPGLLGLSVALEIQLTALNAPFLSAQLARLDLNALLQQASGSSALKTMPKEVRAAIGRSLTAMGPVIESRARTALDSVVGYLLGKRPSPDLVDTLGSSFINAEFVTDIVDSVDIAGVAGAALRAQVIPRIPDDAAWVRTYLDTRFPALLARLTPRIKEQVKAASGPIAEYLLGKRRSFAVVITTKPFLDELKADLAQFAREEKVPQLQGLSEDAVGGLIERAYAEFLPSVPASYRISSAMLGSAVPAQLSASLKAAESALVQARAYVRGFQVSLVILAGAVILLMGAIVLLYRRLVPSSRHIGIVLLAAGAAVFAILLLARWAVAQQARQALQVSEVLAAWIPGIIQGLSAPLFLVALGEVLAGAALIILSIVAARRAQPAVAAAP